MRHFEPHEVYQISSGGGFLAVSISSQAKPGGGVNQGWALGGPPLQGVQARLGLPQQQPWDGESIGSLASLA